MAKLNNLNLLDFLGEASNTDNPSFKTFKKIENMEINRKPGTLTLRPGYTLRYEKPTVNLISDPEYLTFDNFYEKTAAYEGDSGQEITVLVGRGVLTKSGYTSSIKMPLIWIRPFWTGAYWQNSWRCLTEPLLAKVQATETGDSTYSNTLIRLDIDTVDIIGWTAINLTRPTYDPQRVLTAVQDTGNVRVNISNRYHWQEGDEILLIRNYLPLTNMEEMYNAEALDFSFHRINSDMRIGYGGKENRLGLMIGYRKKYFQFQGFDISAVHPDLTTEAAQLNFLTVNRVILEPHCIVNFQNYFGDYIYNLNYSIVAGAGITEGLHYLKITAVLDKFNEQIVYQGKMYFETMASKEIILIPRIFWALMSLRLTSIKVYHSSDDLEYDLLKEYVVAADKYEIKNFSFTNNGWLNWFYDPTTELYTESNALSNASDSDSLGTITWGSGFGTSLISDTGSLSSHELKFSNDSNADDDSFVIYIPLISSKFKSETNYTVAFQIKLVAGVGQVGQVSCGVYFKDRGDPLTENFNLTDGAYISKSLTIYSGGIKDYTSSPDELRIQLNNVDIGSVVRIDLLSIKENPGDDLDTLITNQGNSIDTELGYAPSFNVVKSWDQCVVTESRSCFLNPYVNKRYDNYIMRSHITGTQYMWDIATTEKLNLLEQNNGAVTRAITLLSNGDLLVLMDSMIFVLDPETDQRRSKLAGVGIEGKRTLLNLNGTVYWGSQDDIMFFSESSGEISGKLSDNTIRDIYKALTTKNLMTAVRGDFNTYRVTLGDNVSKEELMISDRGWVQEKRYLYPEIYRLGLSGVVWFINQGNIYAFPADENNFVGYADVYGNYNSGW